MSFIDFESIQFADEKTLKVMALLPAVRTSRANVLISGPTGSGKSALAKNIFRLADFVSLDVVDLHEDFDFAAFFERKSQSSCLLENVDRLTISQQKKLMEALNEPQDSENIRILSTCRSSLKNLVQKNLFREDLYYRLTVLSLELPALSERIADLESIANYLVRVFAIIHHKSDLVFSPEAVEKMKMWIWPGNIRELENVVERAVILTKKSVIEASEIAIENQNESSQTISFAGMTLSQVEQKLILQTLQLTEQNRTRAAEILGISIRTLRNKINEYRQAGLV
jgi:two-component system response regulator FlrC